MKILSSVLALTLSIVGCKTTADEGSKAKDITTDVANVPQRIVINASLKLSTDASIALGKFGYIDGKNCFVTYRQANSAGGDDYFLDVFNIPCGSATSAPNLSSETLRQRMLNLQIQKSQLIARMTLVGPPPDPGLEYRRSSYLCSAVFYIGSCSLAINSNKLVMYSRCDDEDLRLEQLGKDSSLSIDTKNCKIHISNYNAIDLITSGP